MIAGIITVLMVIVLVLIRLVKRVLTGVKQRTQYVGLAARDTVLSKWYAREGFKSMKVTTKVKMGGQA